MRSSRRSIANGDGTVTIGVAAAGPRDDNGYYQSLVNFAEEYSAANGFAPHHS